MEDQKIIFVPYPTSEFFNRIEMMIDASVHKACEDLLERERPTKFLSIIDVMKMYGVSRQSISNWRKKGLPEQTMPGTKRIFFKETDLIDMMKTIRPYKKYNSNY